MKVFVLVKVFGSIIQDVHIFHSYKEAKEAFKEYTGVEYEEAYIDGELNMSEKFDQTEIFKKEI